MGLEEVAQQLGILAVSEGLTICTAESCTGGLIAGTITDVPGSSGYFLGGVVVYSNTAKQQLLGVPAGYLSTFGAVSAPVALAMARGAIKLLGADIAIATTGIAGPSGGSPAKPVGLVYIAVIAPGRALCRRHLLGYDRWTNKASTARIALLTAIELAGAKPL